MEIINYEKKDMKPLTTLTKEQKKIHCKQKTCYI